MARHLLLLTLLSWVCSSIQQDVRLSSSAPTVSEGGGVTTITVVLTRIPTDNVDVEYEPLNNVGISLASYKYTFTSATWNRAQTITITAVDDLQETESRVYRFGSKVNSNDNSFRGQQANFDVQFVDNDLAKPVLSAPTNPYVGENGNSTIFGVSLLLEPLSDVRCTFSVKPDFYSQKVELKPSDPVQFNAATYTVIQEMTVTGKDDLFADGIQALQITAVCEAQSSDYKGKVSDPITIYHIDDEVAFLRTTTTQLITTEGVDTPTQFSLSLSAKPREDVDVFFEVPFGAANEGLAVQTQKKFAVPWWDEPMKGNLQSVDDGARDGDFYYTLRMRTESADLSFNGLVLEIPVVNLDNDGYTHIRYTPYGSRNRNNVVETSELLLRAKTSIGYEDIDVSASNTSCYFTGDSGGCPNGDTTQALIDGDPRTHWSTIVGDVNVDILFDRPRTVCAHALSLNVEDSNPTMWMISVKTGESDSWKVVYNSSTTYPRSGSVHTTEYYDACNPGTILGMYTDAPQTPEPSFAAANPADTTDADPPSDDDESVVWLVITVIIVFVIVLVAILLLLYQNHTKAAAKETDYKERDLGGLDDPPHSAPPLSDPSRSPRSLYGSEPAPVYSGYQPMGTQAEPDAGHIDDELVDGGGYNIVIMYSGRGAKKSQIPSSPSSAPSVSHPLPSEEGYSSRYFRRQY